MKNERLSVARWAMHDARHAENTMRAEFIEFPCHISSIRIGDTVLHNGQVVTVSRGNLKNCPFMGITFRGDSYRLGRQPVIRLVEGGAK